MRLAKNAVKLDIRDRGLKLHNYSAKEISIAAEEWLERHPELINQATTTLARWADTKSKVMHSPGGPRKSVASAVQISGAK
jgi:hypothetical protein